MMESFLSNKILSEMRVFGIFVYLLKKCSIVILPLYFVILCRPKTIAQ